MEPATAIALAAGLGLLGFIEPCSVGSHLLFIKYTEQATAASKAFQTVVFTLTRALFMAALGLSAAFIGSGFTGLQHGLWGALGLLYVVVGLLYAGGGAPWLVRHLGRFLPALGAGGGSAGLGVLFGLNIPVCAAPLLALLLGDAAARAAAGGTVLVGGSALFVFGLALSSPLLLAVYTGFGRRILDAITRVSARMPRWTGFVLVLLGVWSLYQAAA